MPGYETAGEVVAAGDESDGSLKPGDRVKINECRKYGDVCAAWGGGSEYTVKDSDTTNDTFDYMVKIPENLSYIDGVLAYLPCVALKGIRMLNLEGRQTIVVSGAGMVGISAMQILKIVNPNLRVIAIEPNKFRRDIAKKYVDLVADPFEAELVIRKATGGAMADQIIECSGNAEVPGILHKYLKDGGWGTDDAPGHIHWQGDYPEKIIMDSYHRWFRTAQFPCPVRWRPAVRSRFLPGSARGNSIRMAFRWRSGRCRSVRRHLNTRWQRARMYLK